MTVFRMSHARGVTRSGAPPRSGCRKTRAHFPGACFHAPPRPADPRRFSGPGQRLDRPPHGSVRPMAVRRLWLEGLRPSRVRPRADSAAAGPAPKLVPGSTPSSRTQGGTRDPPADGVLPLPDSGGGWTTAWRGPAHGLTFPLLERQGLSRTVLSPDGLSRAGALPGLDPSLAPPPLLELRVEPGTCPRMQSSLSPLQGKDRLPHGAVRPMANRLVH
jgi:hypothetical protein